jgi:hypothetical protein
MGVRALGAIASLGAYLALAAPVRADVVSLNASAVCPAPRVDGVSYTAAGTPTPAPSHVVPNQAKSGTIEIAGANLSATGCTTTVMIGGATFTHAEAQTDTVTVTLTPSAPMPVGASGAVAVLLTDALGDTNSSNSGSAAVFNLIQSPMASALDLSPVEDSTETATGNGFSPCASEAHGGLPGASVRGIYGSCFGPAQSFAATVVATPTGAGKPPSYDSSLQLPAPGTYCNGSLSLAFTAPYVEDPHQPASGPDCAAVHPQNCIQATVDANPAAPIDVAFAVSSVAPRSASPGQIVTVIGSGFGPSGRATIGGAAAAVSWRDRSIQLTIPAGAATGDLTVQRLTGDQEALNLLTITIAPPGTAGAPGAAGGSETSGPATVTVNPGSATATSDPGSASPTAAVSQGQAHASAAGGANLPFGLGQLTFKVNGNPLVIWLSVATAILVALGVLVNLEVLRRWLWSISGARFRARGRSHGRT